MNEAERCDRISLMHAGRVLDVGTPTEIVERHAAASLEDAFVERLRAETPDDGSTDDLPAISTGSVAPTALHASATRLWAHTWRETLELIRDPIRMFFALAGPVILLVTIGFGISFDVDEISFAVNDQDRSPESHRLIEAFSSIPQFDQKVDFATDSELDRRMGRGDLTVALEIPDGFGKALHQSETTPQVSLWVDGSMPFRADTARGYAAGLLSWFSGILTTESGGTDTSSTSIVTRFKFNQAFKSAYAMVPSALMLVLMLIPAIMSTISVVREKETGTIANFRSTPVRRYEFLIGKQLPYIAVSWFSFWVLTAIGRLVFGVPFTGSLPALALAALLYVTATTGFGQAMSSVTRTQVSAVFATAVLSIIPTVNFSGLILPVSTLDTSARLIGLSFPGAWFQQVSVGTALKAYDFGDVAVNLTMLAVFCLAYLAIALVGLRKQEP